MSEDKRNTYGDGCWVVWSYSDGPQAYAVFGQELDAHRFVQDQGYMMYVQWCEWGELSLGRSASPSFAGLVVDP